MKLVETIDSVVREATAVKPKGKARYRKLLEAAAQTDQLRLFVPWAASPGGRSKVGFAERQTAHWLHARVWNRCVAE